jgi:hypothetical protein
MHTREMLKINLRFSLLVRTIEVNINQLKISLSINGIQPKQNNNATKIVSIHDYSDEHVSFNILFTQNNIN